MQREPGGPDMGCLICHKVLELSLNESFWKNQRTVRSQGTQVLSYKSPLIEPPFHLFFEEKINGSLLGQKGTKVMSILEILCEW